jgi:hypothetical protein
MVRLTSNTSEVILTNTDYLANKYGISIMKQVLTIFTTSHPVGSLLTLQYIKDTSSEQNLF